MANWDQQPAWLVKKRQLAAALQEQLPRFNGQEKWLPWQRLGNGYQEKGLVHDDTYYARPLDIAVQQYPELLQENLMEKGLEWQATQLNAAHLANIDGGQFIYVPDNQQVTMTIKFAPQGMMANPHNVIIVGANSQVTIEERMAVKSAQPMFAATELLVGANAKVTYRQANQLRAPVIFQSLNLYQAHGTNVLTQQLIDNEGNVTIYLSNFLDGNGSQWQAQTLLRPHRYGQHLFIPQVDGYGNDSQATLTTYVDVSKGGQVNRQSFKAGNRAPLPVSQQTSTSAAAEDLPDDSWLNQ